MALPASGQISLSQVNTELGNSPTATISLNDSAVRALFTIPSGQISMSDGYGKSSGPPYGMVAGGRHNPIEGGICNASNEIFGFCYSSETTFPIAATMSVGRFRYSATNNDDKAFLAGTCFQPNHTINPTLNAATTNIDIFCFSTCTRTTPGAKLHPACATYNSTYLGTIAYSSQDCAYYLGGRTGVPPNTGVVCFTGTILGKFSFSTLTHTYVCSSVPIAAGSNISCFGVPNPTGTFWYLQTPPVTVCEVKYCFSTGTYFGEQARQGDPAVPNSAPLTFTPMSFGSRFLKNDTDIIRIFCDTSAIKMNWSTFTRSSATVSYPVSPFTTATTNASLSANPNAGYLSRLYSAPVGNICNIHKYCYSTGVITQTAQCFIYGYNPADAGPGIPFSPHTGAHGVSAGKAGW